MTNRRSWIFLILLALPGAGALPAMDLELLPGRRIIRPFTANAVEHRMSLAKVFEENRYIGSFGGVVPLIGLGFDGYAAQFCVAGTFYTHLSAAERQFIVANGDYYVDATIDVRLSRAFSLRTGMGHTSQHLMDDALEVTKLPRSINFVRDYVQLFAVHTNPAIGGFLYAGCFYNTTFIIDEHLDGTMIYQAGGEGLNLSVAPMASIYVAADCKWRGESAYGTTQNYQVGIKIAREEGGRTLRCALNYRTGLEERGQFYSRRISRTSLGLYLDL